MDNTDCIYSGNLSAAQIKSDAELIESSCLFLISQQTELFILIRNCSVKGLKHDVVETFWQAHFGSATNFFVLAGYGHDEFALFCSGARSLPVLIFGKSKPFLLALNFPGIFVTKNDVHEAKQLLKCI